MKSARLPKQLTREQEVNLFARWFGNMLIELKNQNLREKVQPRRPYARVSDFKFICHG